MYYIVEKIPNSVPSCNTIEDLQRYLSTNPHPVSRLISAQFINGTFLLIWEE